MKKITQIFDGDYGCEERKEEGFWVSVSLMDDQGEETWIRVLDSWLIERNLDIESHVWPKEGKVFEK